MGRGRRGGHRRGGAALRTLAAGREGDAGRIRYFADVRSHTSCNTLVPALNTEAQSEDRDAEQLLALAPIIWKKYRAIMVAIIALSVGVTLTVVAAILG